MPFSGRILSFDSCGWCGASATTCHCAEGSKHRWEREEEIINKALDQEIVILKEESW